MYVNVDQVMLSYFILFVIVGAFSTFLLKEVEKVTIAFVIIALIWSSSSGIFWGLVSFGELWAGYAAFNFLAKK